MHLEEILALTCTNGLGRFFVVCHRVLLGVGQRSLRKTVKPLQSVLRVEMQPHVIGVTKLGLTDPYAQRTIGPHDASPRTTRVFADVERSVERKRQAQPAPPTNDRPIEL